MKDLCIYCNQSNDWSYEHCVPRGLGKFKDQHFLKNHICKTCNTKIGEVEGQFLRSGPQAHFRHILGIKGRKHHKRRSPFLYGISGASPLKILLEHPEEKVNLLWEVEFGTNNIHQMDQIVFKNEKNEEIPILLNSSVYTEEGLRNHLNKYGINIAESNPIFFHVSKDKWDMFVEILKKIFPKKIPEKRPNSELKGGTFAPIEFSVTKLYFQAVAKIGFHYFLSLFKNQFKGSEPVFEPIRSFIISGNGEIKDFVKQTKNQFIFDFKGGYRLKRWGHILAAEKTNDFIFSKLQFFVGPENIPPVFHVKIGKNPQKFKLPESYGHLYSYYENGPRNNFDGEIQEIHASSLLSY